MDSVPTAIETARREAEGRGPRCNVPGDGRPRPARDRQDFSTVIDSGLFPTLSDPERPRFVPNLSMVLKPGETCFIFGFSDLEPGEYGPRRITPKEIHAICSEGWRIDECLRTQNIGKACISFLVWSEPFLGDVEIFLSPAVALEDRQTIESSARPPSPSPDGRPRTDSAAARCGG